MRTQIRIVGGSLRGRKLISQVPPGVRPTPDMVRQALFSILGNAIPNRPFFDVFAGTGIVGMEAISRGSGPVTFVERDFRHVAEIEHHLKHFGIAERGNIIKADVYRWANRWQAPPEPVNVFVSPPFADYTGRPEEMLLLATELRQRVHPESVLVLQADRERFPVLPAQEQWEERRYGRNILFLWVKESPPSPDATPTP
jgi:16S rRNA (guanine(966)-N(2))-methyltransferase RsmD